MQLRLNNDAWKRVQHIHARLMDLGLERDLADAVVANIRVKLLEQRRRNHRYNAERKRRENPDKRYYSTLTHNERNKWLGSITLDGGQRERPAAEPDEASADTKGIRGPEGPTDARPRKTRERTRRKGEVRWLA